MDEDEDVYVNQLRDVFDVCDTERTGKLNREQLEELCEKLQLATQSDALITYLLGSDDGEGQIDFETFKEGFVMILSNDLDISVADDEPSETENDASISMSLNLDLEDEVSPKYVRNGKRFGRRSRPDLEHSLAYSEADYSSQMELKSPVELTKYSDSRISTGKQDSENESSDADADLDLLDEVGDLEEDQPSKEKPSNLELPRNETFEGDGEMNASMSVLENPATEKDQVQKIWEDVGVGKDGFLDMDELAIVCEHIGMEDMDKEELLNLFSKLDEDQDGRVGFDEFLLGLFRHEGPHTPMLSTPSVMSPSHKSRLTRLVSSALDDPYHRTTTPSTYHQINPNKLFTSLDPENSGYVNADDVIEYWQSQGMHNPLEVLEALEIDMEAGKINLQELSYALEHILEATGDDNGIFQAALTAFQGEIKHLRSQVESSHDERDKLKADLAESNQRSASMLQEIDERHANIERTHETKLKAVERKYQGKINALQAELAMDRETLTSHAIKQRQSLENELETLRADEAQLRTRVEILQKENERLDTENEKAAEKLIDSEKTISKQQRDLIGFQELEDRLAGLENNTDTISKQQIEHYENALRDYQELLRKEHDKVDELTQENELLKHQSSERKVRRRGSKFHRQGRSMLGDYSGKHKTSLSSSENESDGEEMETDIKPPSEDRAGGDGNSNTEEEMKKMDAEVAKWEAKLNSMQEQYNHELSETKAQLERELEAAKVQFEREYTDMEEKYKVKIIEMEDDFEKERATLREDLEREKEQINSQLTELEKVLETEREELREHFESEKEETKEKFETENASLRKQLEDLQDELDAKLEDLRVNLERQKDEEVTSLEKDLAKERKASELQIRKLQEELELKMKNKKEDIEAFYKKERDELELQLKEKVSELEMILKDGEAGLQGQLKEDFIELLATHKENMEERYEQERELLLEKLEKEREELQEAFEQEKSELSTMAGEEKDELLRQLQNEKSELMERFKKDKIKLEERFKQEKQKLSERHSKEKEQLKQELNKDKKRLSQEVQKESDKTVRQVKKEKSELEKQLQKEREKFKLERENMEAKLAFELDALHDSFNVEKEQLERGVREEIEEESRRAAKKDFEEELAQVVQDMEEEKAEIICDKEELELQLKAAKVAAEEAVTAVNLQVQQAIPGELEATKAQISMIEAERDQFKKDLDDANRRFMEQQMQMSISESQYTREVQRLKAKQQEELVREMQQLQLEMKEMEKQLKDAQKVHKHKEEQMMRALDSNKDVESNEMKVMKQQKEEAEKKFKRTRNLLNEYMKKLKEQLSKSTRSDVLVKELYIENSKLQRALQLTEERQKKAERNSINLIEKNHAYLGLIKKVCPANV
ncbi:uncharacterized protein [Apostichopus japonicus]|uniref:uncharacterized protein isoform X2 n=1 Tax=Stichopus japonicus TaxID=307972 RepID=UPI003AB7E173